MLNSVQIIKQERFYVQGLCDLDFCPSDPKINTDHLWWMTHHINNYGGLK